MTSTSNNSYSDPNITPPLGQALPLGLQHVLAMFASNVTPAIIVAGAAGLGFGSPEQIYLIQMAMLFAGIATLFQTIGIGPVGARLPIMQGTSFAFVGVLAGLAATQGLSVALTSCIIAGLIHFALGSVISSIRSWFPPLVTGLVILAIGLYLIPVGIKYAAGGAADFQMTADSFGSLKHWSVALTVIIVALLVKFRTSGALSNAAILIGLLAGYALAYMLVSNITAKNPKNNNQPTSTFQTTTTTTPNDNEDSNAKHQIHNINCNRKKAPIMKSDINLKK